MKFLINLKTIAVLSCISVASFASNKNENFFEYLGKDFIVQRFQSKEAWTQEFKEFLDNKNKKIYKFALKITIISYTAWLMIPCSSMGAALGYYIGSKWHIETKPLIFFDDGYVQYMNNNLRRTTSYIGLGTGAVAGLLYGGYKCFWSGANNDLLNDLREELRSIIKKKASKKGFCTATREFPVETGDALLNEYLDSIL